MITIDEHKTAGEAVVDQRLRLMAGVTLALTLVLVALGGAVRATDSGLACPDWPFCYGQVIPRQHDIPADSGYTLWNVWLEHSHRLVASLVSLLIAVLVGWAVLRHRGRRAVLWPVVAALVAVLVQATLGALVVLHLLKAELVTAHLGMSMVVVACLVFLVATTSPGCRWPAGRWHKGEGTLGRAAMVVCAIVLTQILVGGQVTGMHAALAYGADPLRFDGELMPQWPTTSAEAIHVSHRLLAGVVAVAVLALAWAVVRCHRRSSAALHPSARIAAVVLSVAMLGQIALGFANMWLLLPPEIVTAHLAVASWVWTSAAALAVLLNLVPVSTGTSACREGG